MLQKSADFTPHAAFFAALEPDGSVVVREFNDPAITIVVVAEFEVQGDDYIAIYHEDLDEWEISSEEYNDEQYYDLAGPDTPFYIFAEATIDAFRDNLLAGPGSGRIARKLAREMIAEIDRDIIKDLHNNIDGTLPTITFSPQQVTNRKLKETWTMEDAKDLKVMTCTKTVYKSRLIRTSS